MIKYIHLILYKFVVGESNHVRGPIPPHPKGWGLLDPLTPRVEEIKGLREDIQPGYSTSFRQMQADIKAIKGQIGMV